METIYIIFIVTFLVPLGIIVPLLQIAGFAHCEECHQTTLNNCQSSRVDTAVADLFQNDKQFPNEEFLNRYCSLFLGKLECMAKYEDSCPISDMVMEPFLGLSAVQDLIGDVCNEDSVTRTRYLENVPCINDHFAEIQRRMSFNDNYVYDFKVKKLRYYEDTNPDEEEFDAFNRAILCLEQKYLRSRPKLAMIELCGEAAYDVFSEFSSRLQGSLSSLCPENDSLLQRIVLEYDEYKIERTSDSEKETE